MTPRQKRVLYAVLGVVFCGLSLWAFLSWRHERAREKAVRCYYNMRYDVASGLFDYAEAHADLLPPDLATLLDTPSTTPDSLICPASSDTVAPGGTPAQQAQAVRTTPGHCSYIYLGAGKFRKQLPDGFVLVYEPLSNHGYGVTVIFGDGHPEWFDAHRAKALIAELQAGHNPPRPGKIPPEKR